MRAIVQHVRFHLIALYELHTTASPARLGRCMSIRHRILIALHSEGFVKLLAMAFVNRYTW